MIAILEYQKPIITINSLIWGLTFDFHNTVKTFNATVIPEMKTFIEDETAEVGLLEADKKDLLHYRKLLKRMRTGRGLAKAAQRLDTPDHVQEFVHYANLYFLKIDRLLSCIDNLLQDTTEILLKDKTLMARVARYEQGNAELVSFGSDELEALFQGKRA